MFIPEKQYRVIIKNTIIETIDIIVLNNKWQILLGCRNNEPMKWVYYIPWWRRYKNELINNSIMRKAKEELWINIKIEKLIFLWIYDDIYDNSMFEWLSSHYSSITYVYILNELEEKTINKDNQHSDLKFFDINDYTLHDMIKIRIKDIGNKSII